MINTLYIYTENYNSFLQAKLLFEALPEPQKTELVIPDVFQKYDPMIGGMAITDLDISPEDIFVFLFPNPKDINFLVREYPKNQMILVETPNRYTTGHPIPEDVYYSHVSSEWGNNEQLCEHILISNRLPGGIVIRHAGVYEEILEWIFLHHTECPTLENLPAESQETTKKYFETFYQPVGKDKIFYLIHELIKNQILTIPGTQIYHIFGKKVLLNKMVNDLRKVMTNYGITAEDIADFVSITLKHSERSGTEMTPYTNHQTNITGTYFMPFEYIVYQQSLDATMKNLRSLKKKAGVTLAPERLI